MVLNNPLNGMLLFLRSLHKFKCIVWSLQEGAGRFHTQSSVKRVQGVGVYKNGQGCGRSAYTNHACGTQSEHLHCMKKLTKYTILTIYCRCGCKLLKYKKGPGRRLLKIHRDRITEDYTGIFINDFSDKGTDIYCPSCGNRIATVQIINGKYVNKVNQGQLGLTK